MIDNSAKWAGLCAGAVVIAAATAVVMTRSHAAAVVGETRTIAIAKPADSTIDALRAEYRRPNFIPFPKDNPYTAEKAALGKKL